MLDGIRFLLFQMSEAAFSSGHGIVDWNGLPIHKVGLRWMLDC